VLRCAVLCCFVYCRRTLLLRRAPIAFDIASGRHDHDALIGSVTASRLGWWSCRRYARIARCQGHSSYITHVDWSLDSRVIQSNCGAYELLHFDAFTGKQVCH
jgi:hypothetical protein